MSAAAARAALAAIGRDLLALDGSPGERRAAALLRGCAGRDEEPPVSFADLADTPAWLRTPPDAQRRIAVAAALLSMGPTLAACIDGAWLGRLAERAGEDLLDWAIERAAAAPGDGGFAPLAADELEAAGFALLRAELAPGLRRHLRWAPGGVAAVRAPTAVAEAQLAPAPGALAAEPPDAAAEPEAAPRLAEAA